MGQEGRLKASLLNVLAIIVTFILANHDAEAGFYPGSVVVLGVATNNNLVSSLGTQIVMWEYRPDGTLMQTLAVNCELFCCATFCAYFLSHLLASFSLAGDTSNEGLMTLSPDGSTLAFMCYASPVGTSSITSTQKRVVVLVRNRIKFDWVCFVALTHFFLP